MASVQHETVTTRELQDRLDRLAQDELRMSGDEFIEKYRQGEFVERPRFQRLVLLARLLLAAQKRT